MTAKYSNYLIQTGIRSSTYNAQCDVDLSSYYDDILCHYDIYIMIY